MHAESESESQVHLVALLRAHHPRAMAVRPGSGHSIHAFVVARTAGFTTKHPLSRVPLPLTARRTLAEPTILFWRNAVFVHNQRPQYTVRVAAHDPGLANLLLEQFGGP